jgi:glycosyltransferase involved in cell wall biosynthesis
MKVLQVIPELDAGGAERTTLDIAAALAKRGDRAFVASRGGRLEAELAQLGGELVRLPVQSKNPVTLVANAFALADLVRCEEVDVIHARSRAPAWSALWAARMAGCAFVTTYHGAYKAKSGLKRWYNSGIARGDVVIANSEFTADRIRAEHGAVPKRIVVIPRGLDLAALDPAAVSSERTAMLAAAWGLDRARPVVLMPGRLTRWKGQGVMIEAAALLKARGGPQAVFALPGDDQGRTGYRAELEGMIDSHGLRDSVILPGHCSDMPAAYAVADVVVSASTEPEAFGRVAVEGAAMARPVIATDHGGARETIEDGAGGRLVPPGDAGAMAGALAEILAAPAAVRMQMGARAAARARAKFSVEAMQAATLQVYDELVRAGRRA